MTNEEKFLLLSAALIDENDSQEEILDLIDNIINSDELYKK